MEGMENEVEDVREGGRVNHLHFVGRRIWLYTQSEVCVCTVHSTVYPRAMEPLSMSLFWPV